MINATAPVRCLGVLAAVLVLFAGARAHAEDPLPEYAYQDTRDLIAVVDDAARLVEGRGPDIFPEFAVKGSRWFSGSTYLFVYDLDGVCVFHAATPDLMGKNLLPLRDMNGKPVIRYITDVGRRPEPDAAEWVFYLWQEGKQLSPIWKAAYIRKAVGSDGKVYLIGSGLYDIKIERAFVAERVDRAVGLIESAGEEAAFKAFLDRSSPFNFLDTYVFVLDQSGHTIVDPAFPNMDGRDMSTFEDAVGFRPIAEVLKRLATEDDAWVQFLWPRAGEATPSRKLIYARKMVTGGKTIIVGSDFFLATPIWMRVEADNAWLRGLPG
jgi:signal transduction histidine kinase